MKPAAVVMTLLLFLRCIGEAQEDSEKAWSFRPTISVIKFLPGEEIVVPCPECYGSYESQYRFAGTGLSFGVRAMHPDLKGFVLTFGTGVNWFYPPDNGAIYGITPSNASAGVGETLKREEFNTFPLTAGVQLVFPQSNPDAFMGFLGADGSVHFIDGNLAIGEQTRFGYDLLAGFAVKVFEVGVRYASFSDVTNLGVHLGLRLPSFGL